MEEITEKIDHESNPNAVPKIPTLKEHSIQIPYFLEKLLEQQQSPMERRISDFLRHCPSLDWMKNLKLSSPFSLLRRTANRRDEISLGVPSPAAVRYPFIRRINNLSSLLSISKEWLSHPMNSALLLWLLCVTVSGIMLGLLMLGLLNQSFPTKASRKRWIEINNQILNALFTLMSTYQHPVLFHHMFMLCRWRSEDIIELRKIYCKNDTHRPNEWAHMVVVVILLHITCLAQYALCGVYWCFNRFKRPEFLEYLFIALGVAAPLCAGVYAIYGPLGREYESNVNDECKTRMNGNGRRTLVNDPQWIGGLFDFFGDFPVAYLSCCCTCCVFGWNMERLGFGNMYVHAVTFLLLCFAPFWIFNVSAIKVHDYVIGDVLGISGIVLCVFGLLYGGFWRIQLRKRLGLPENRLCCGSASFTDYLQWLFCWGCALAQEVRTGNFYDVEDDSLCRRLSRKHECRSLMDGLGSDIGSNTLSLTTEEEKEQSAPMSVATKEDGVEDVSLVVPPVQPLMKVEDEGEVCIMLTARDGMDQRVLPLVKVDIIVDNLHRAPL